MSEINLGVDLGSVDRGKSSDIIPKGEYLAEISGARHNVNEKNGNEALVVEFTVKADNDGGKWIGSTFAEFYSLKENAMWKIAAFLDAVYGHAFKGSKLNPAEVVGKSICIRTFLDDYEGRESTKVQKFMPAAKFSGKLPAGSNSAGTTAAAGNESVSV